ncbi:hypothetical protein F2P56_013801 [Juglans regia]|uniref:Retrotransposon Copia-like N-terminal domain-containing protein n=1 Tax=Juglans regia TaxID=51240 RepID=A0A833XC38_JUGRE|nr:hypothetical protein F2P56_013801 [Juglans regia]
MAMLLASPIPQPSSSLISSFSHVVTVKLTTENFLLWKVQISAYLIGQDLYCYIDGTLPCPEKLVAPGSDAPPTFNPNFTSWAKDFHIRFQLTNLSCGEKTITEYFGKVRSLADTLAATGNPLPDKELVTYILIGLGPLYESFVTSITTRSEFVSSHELFQMLLIHESRMAHSTKQLLEPSVNVSVQSSQGGQSQRGRHPFRGRQGRGRGNNRSPGGRFGSNFSGNQTQTSGGAHPICQVCQKMGHVALQCRHRFNHSINLKLHHTSLPITPPTTQISTLP